MIRFTVIEQNGEKYILEMPHVQYYEFAKQNFLKHQRVSKVVANIRKKRTKKNSKPNIKETHAWLEYHESMINILLYGALSLEAYMNYYSKRYEFPYKNQLDRQLTPPTKWGIYPLLKLNKGINSDSLKIINHIFQMRNKFVHATPEKISANVNEDYESKSVGAELELLDKGKLFFNINSVYKAIFSIDQDEAKDHKNHPWLFEIRKK